MKNLTRTIMRTDDALGRGMEFAIVTLVFLGVGFGLDRWIGTTPLFMILLVVIGLVGQFARLWYGYEAAMRELEAERAEVVRARSAGSTRVADRATGEEVDA